MAAGKSNGATPESPGLGQERDQLHRRSAGGVRTEHVEHDAPTVAVRVESLGKMIDDMPILDDISFELPAGRSLALLGANGAGKSTLLKILATLIPATAGQLMLFGMSLARPDIAVRSRIGLIGHRSMLYRDLSAFENLVFFGRLYGVPHPQQRARQLLDEFNLGPRRDDQVKTFSRGMLQRVAIARALMHDPDLLLADEPFTGLDAPSVAAVVRQLHDLRAQGRTIILADHDIARSLEFADEAIVLRRGRLVLHRLASELDEAGVLEEIAIT